MGIVRMGPPTELVECLAVEYAIPNFIETGTYYGWTATWAAQHFSKVFTVEYAQELYTHTSQQLAHIPNIECLFGDSRTELAKLFTHLTGKSLVWLDAHWSGDQTYGADDECPLLEELRMLNLAAEDVFLFIDDARLFTSPPPLPHRIDQWPAIAEILSLVQSEQHRRYSVIIDDVIIVVPEYARDTLAHYCQERNTQAWEMYGRQMNTSDFRKGIHLIRKDLARMFNFFHKTP